MAEDIQQQIADGARPRLARVGDVIEHGQDIPVNVVRLRDMTEDAWRRLATDPVTYTYMGYDDPEPSYTADQMGKHKHWWPMTVVEVDPEPQPAERDDGALWCPGFVSRAGVDTDGCLRLKGTATGDNQLDPEPPHWYRCDDPEPHAEHGARSKLGRTRCTGLPLPPAESGPLVLTLPVVPDGAVALVGGKSGARWERTTYGWKSGGYHLTFPAVLDREGSVTVEMAPPREPRVWPKLDVEADLPAEVEVTGEGIWRRVPGTRLFRQGTLLDGTIRDGTLADLRELGEVREVLT